MDDIEQPVSERVTVTLSPKAVQALDYVTKYLDDTKTDVINKALRLYKELALADRSGRGVYIRTVGDGFDGELERVRFIL